MAIFYGIFKEFSFSGMRKYFRYDFLFSFIIKALIFLNIVNALKSSWINLLNKTLSENFITTAIELFGISLVKRVFSYRICCIFNLGNIHQVFFWKF